MARGTRLRNVLRAAYVELYDEDFAQEALAARAGVSRNTVSRMLSGQVGELSSLVAVANACGLSVFAALAAMDEEDVRPWVTPRPPADEVATAIREQTAVLTKVLERLAPGEQTPTPSPRRAPRASRTAARMARASTRSTGADERER